MHAEVSEFIEKCLKPPSRQRIESLSQELADKLVDWINEFHLQVIQVNECFLILKFGYYS